MDELEQVRRERDYWRDVAAYLAECHAATAEYEGGLKRTSESSRRRFRSICEIASQAMRPGAWNERKRQSIEGAGLRCAEAAARLRTPTERPE